MFTSKLLLYGFGLASAVLLTALTVACQKSAAPAGEGSADENGAPRDPSKILPLGVEAPDFTATTDEGATVVLADLRGKQNVVLIFYPGNETPGCTTQLCTARDDWSAYQKNDVAVFGVNPASVASHAAFRKNHNFPFPLISDGDGQLVRSYGSRGIGGLVTRTVYGIGREGKVVFAERGMPATERILAAFSN